MASKNADERIARTEHVLDAIEMALEAQWTEETTEMLPEELRDPLRVMERGQELLSTGLVFCVASPAVDTYESEFRMAARNGKAIPEWMKSRMHSEREEAEAQMVLTFDEPR
jgi:hypothetical protein